MPASFCCTASMCVKALSPSVLSRPSRAASERLGLRGVLPAVRGLLQEDTADLHQGGELIMRI